MKEKYIALTFDDGPNTTTTVEVLNKLETYGVVASFFLIGNLIDEETEKVVKRAVADGCTIQNHSWTHSHMDTMEADVIADEIARTSEKIAELTGTKPLFFRPPFIDVSDVMYDTIQMPFICGFHAEDWEESVSAVQRTERILEQAKDGGIILLHDMTGNEQTVEALDTIIPTLLSEGYQFVTITELFQKKGIAIEPKRDTLYTYL